MSYQEKRVLTNIAAGSTLLLAYVVYAYSKYSANTEILSDAKFWAGLMLSFIGIGIGLMIIIQIVFHILYSIGIAVTESIDSELNGKGRKSDKEIEKRIKAEFVEDERDRIIELKSLRIGFIFAGIGFVGGLVALYLDSQIGIMLNIFYIAIMTGSITEGITQLYYYRKG
jgi:hypothetical protein